MKKRFWDYRSQLLPSTSKPAPVQPGGAEPLPLGIAPIPLPLPGFIIFFFPLPSPSIEGCWFWSFVWGTFPRLDVLPADPVAGSGVLTVEASWVHYAVPIPLDFHPKHRIQARVTEFLRGHDGHESVRYVSLSNYLLLHKWGYSATICQQHIK